MLALMSDLGAQQRRTPNSLVCRFQHQDAMRANMAAHEAQEQYAYATNTSVFKTPFDVLSIIPTSRNKENK